MATDNMVIITGNIASDPEQRFTQSETGFTTFRVAHNTRRRTESGGWEDGDSSFFSVIAWDTLADNIATSLAKGMRVTVIGKLRTRSWETDSGETRWATEIVADEVSPSLRWASADIHRQGSSGGGGRRSGADAYDPPPGEEPF